MIAFSMISVGVSRLSCFRSTDFFGRGKLAQTQPLVYVVAHRLTNSQMPTVGLSCEHNSKLGALGGSCSESTAFASFRVGLIGSVF